MALNLPAPISKNVLEELTDLFLPQDTVQEAIIVLTISFPASGGSIRELASYLNLIDRFFGRLNPEGFLSYAHRPSQQLRYTEIRVGSCQVVLSQNVKQGEISSLVLVYFLLKYLPLMRPESAEAVHMRMIGSDFYSSNKLARSNKRQLTLQISNDNFLQKLDTRRLNQIATFLDGMYAQEYPHLSLPIRFAISNVIDLQLSVMKLPEEYPLHSTVIFFENPMEPVAEEDWSVLQ